MSRPLAGLGRQVRRGLGALFAGGALLVGVGVTPAAGAAPAAGAPSVMRALIVGDSVTAGVASNGQLPALQAALPGWSVTLDAQESRSTEAGASTIAAHDPASFDVVVVELGLNDAGSVATFDQRAQQVLAELAGVKHVYWLTIPTTGTAQARYRADYQYANLDLAQLAAHHPNLTLVDLDLFFAQHPGDSIDGLHLNAQGAKDYAGLLAQVILGHSPLVVTTTTTSTSTTVAGAEARSPADRAPFAAGAASRAGPGAGSGSGGLVVAGVAAGVVLAVIAGAVGVVVRRRRRAGAG